MKISINKFLFLFNHIHLPTILLHIIVIIITMMCNVGCHIWQYPVPKYLDIEQGIYLTQQNIQKICIGMTKSAILADIGFPPELKNIFGSNKWYYVYCHYNIKGQLIYQTIELEFNSNDILIIINIL